MAYTVCVLLGIVLGAGARRLVHEPETPHRHALGLIALVGATAGAIIFESPADLFGWTAGVAGQPVIQHAFGGRTVVGGLLGGWLAVEAGKRGLGIVQPTGDGFALPLAVGLCFGRIGCFLTGCCAGRPTTGHEWWTRLAIPGHDGVLRFPAQVTEVLFHAIAFVVLLALARRGHFRYRRFAAYVAVYALFRFFIETVRENPPLALGLTYYQWLVLPLFALALGTVIVRSRRDETATSSPAPV
jgi:phosphatidylglycerol:prolipoprotein diacylglycerol transferase